MNSEVKVLSQPFIRTRSRVLDYTELMKPELTFLAVLSTVCGFYLATPYRVNGWLFLHTALGTALLGGGLGALNQFIERKYDAMMRRTERRPLPAGRLLPLEVLIFGVVLSLTGILELTFFANFLTGYLASLTLVTYIFFYTPLKRVTLYSTIIGAIPGALPPVLGWTAVRGSITPEAWALFAILFCWQMPHFLSLAWMYRRDYARAGYKLLTVTDPTGVRSNRFILVFMLALIPASIMTTILGLTGTYYLIGAVVLGLGFLYFGILLNVYSKENSSEPSAKIHVLSRRLFYASLIYLPLLMILMSADKI
ncbi:MAG: heme o synthase [Bacteroidota bacterium]